MIVLPLTMLVALGDGAQRVGQQLMTVTVERDGQGCRFTLNGAHVTSDVLLDSARKQRDRRAVIMYDKDAPYRCVGAAIITLQEAGVMEIDGNPSLPK